MKNMGLGKIGKSSLLIKHKWHWTFEGTNEEGGIIFPLQKIRLDNRPQFPLAAVAAVADENGGKMIHVPGEISFSCVQKEELPKVDDIGLVKFGNLKLIDWQGTVIEEWNMEGVNMVPKASSTYFADGLKHEEINEEIICDEWFVAYEKVNWLPVKGGVELE